MLSALGGGLVALAAREALLATPGVARWFVAALEPLSRAGREGYAPSEAERRRLAVVGTLAVLGGAILLTGPGPIALLALAGPAVATWAISARRARYRRGVERGLPAAANAIADALAGGRSARAALIAAAGSLEGPTAVELARVGSDLELGASSAEAPRPRVTRRFGRLPATGSRRRRAAVKSADPGVRPRGNSPVSLPPGSSPVSWTVATARPSTMQQ
jgi:Flp pilus assembly protein TadB